MSETYDKIKAEAARLFPHFSMGKALLAQGKTQEAMEHLDKFYDGASDLVDQYGDYFAACVVLCHAGGFKSQISSDLGLPFEGFLTAWNTFRKTAPTFIQQKNVEGCNMMITIISTALINFNETLNNEFPIPESAMPHENIFNCFDGMLNIYHQLVNTLKQIDPASESTRNLITTYGRMVPPDFTPDEDFDLFDKDCLTGMIDQIQMAVSSIDMLFSYYSRKDDDDPMKLPDFNINPLAPESMDEYIAKQREVAEKNMQETARNNKAKVENECILSGPLFDDYYNRYWTARPNRLTEADLKEIDSTLDRFFAKMKADVSYDEIFNNLESKFDLISKINGYTPDFMDASIDFNDAYNKLCERYGITPIEYNDYSFSELFPYISIVATANFEKNILRCFLSLLKSGQKDILKYSACNFEEKLAMIESIEDSDVQTLLLSIVSLVNIEFDAVYINNSLLKSRCKKYEIECKLAAEQGIAVKPSETSEHLLNALNGYVDRLNEAGLKHSLPVFTLKDIAIGN